MTLKSMDGMWVLGGLSLPVILQSKAIRACHIGHASKQPNLMESSLRSDPCSGVCAVGGCGVATGDENGEL